MMKKLYFVFAILIIAAMSLSACAPAPEAPAAEEPAAVEAPAEESAAEETPAEFGLSSTLEDVTVNAFYINRSANEPVISKNDLQSLVVQQTYLCLYIKKHPVKVIGVLAYIDANGTVLEDTRTTETFVPICQGNFFLIQIDEGQKMEFPEIEGDWQNLAKPGFTSIIEGGGMNLSFIKSDSWLTVWITEATNGGMLYEGLSKDEATLADAFSNQLARMLEPDGPAIVDCIYDDDESEVWWFGEKDPAGNRWVAFIPTSQNVEVMEGLCNAALGH